MKSMFLRNVLAFILAALCFLNFSYFFKVYGKSTKLYKIRFEVQDSYGKNVDGVRFRILENEKEAVEIQKQVINNKFKEMDNDLISKNGQVISDYVNEGTDYYIVQVSNYEGLKYNNEIIYFKLGEKDNYMTENKMTYYIKDILSKPFELSNLYKMKIIQTDDYGNKISGSVYNVYNNKEDAVSALEQIKNNKVPKNSSHLIEVLESTDTLGVAVSKTYYDEGIYYLVLVNRNEKYEYQSKIIDIHIFSGQTGESIERDKTKPFNYVKQIEPSLLMFQNKYKIKVIDLPKKTYAIFSTENLMNSYLKSKNEKFIMEKIDIKKDRIGISKFYYSVGSYFILDITSSLNATLKLQINKGDIEKIEIDKIYEKSKYIYEIYKLCYKAGLEKDFLKDSKGGIPFFIDNKELIYKTQFYSVYNDSLYGRYIVYDEHNIPIGYIKKEKVKDIKSYDVLGNLERF